jgi:hypothetical protein
MGDAGGLALWCSHPCGPVMSDDRDFRQRTLQVARRMLDRGKKRSRKRTVAYQWPERWQAEEETGVMTGIALETKVSVLFFETLLLASDVAATQPHEPIADKVASVLIRGAGGFSGEVDVMTGMRILVISSGAMRDRALGMEWLASRMSDYAFAIPRGQPCRRLLSELDALQTLLPIRSRCFGKARKFASAGMD